jgi:hypothetical protein
VRVNKELNFDADILKGNLLIKVLACIPEISFEAMEFMTHSAKISSI